MSHGQFPFEGGDVHTVVPVLIAVVTVVVTVIGGAGTIGVPIQRAVSRSSPRQQRPHGTGDGRVGDLLVRKIEDLACARRSTNA